MSDAIRQLMLSGVVLSFGLGLLVGDRLKPEALTPIAAPVSAPSTEAYYLKVYDLTGNDRLRRRAGEPWRPWMRVADRWSTFVVEHDPPVLGAICYSGDPATWVGK